MEEDTFQKVVLGALMLVLVLCYTGIQIAKTGQSDAVRAIKDVGNCGQVVDLIYEQCVEEQSLNITNTIKGRNTTLHYQNGVCVIK